SDQLAGRDHLLTGDVGLLLLVEVLLGVGDRLALLGVVLFRVFFLGVVPEGGQGQENHQQQSGPAKCMPHGATPSQDCRCGGAPPEHAGDAPAGAAAGALPPPRRPRSTPPAGGNKRKLGRGALFPPGPPPPGRGEPPPLPPRRCQSRGGGRPPVRLFPSPCLRV